MRRPIAGILLSVLALTAAACGSSSTPTTPTTPTITTDTFEGTLSAASGVTNTFKTATSGTIAATLTAVGPDSTKVVGFSLGTYNTTLNVCQIVLANDLALQGAILTGQASTSGTYCVRVYDTGQVTADTPFTFTISVSHP
jgi:hypothetical protein